MTNAQIIINECINNKLFTKEQLEKMTDIPVHTYQYWKELGYQVRKGEKAAIKTKLWKQITFKTEDGASAKKLILASAALFTSTQVDKIDAETSAPEKKTSSAAEKRTSSAQKKTSSAKAKKTLTKQEAEENLKKIEETPVQLVKKEETEAPEEKKIQILGEQKSCEALAKLMETVPEKYILTFTHMINDTCAAIEAADMRKVFPLDNRKMDTLAKYVDKSIDERPCDVRNHITGFLIDQIQRMKNYRKPNHAKIAGLKQNLIRITAA